MSAPSSSSNPFLALLRSLTPPPPHSLSYYAPCTDLKAGNSRVRVARVDRTEGYHPLMDCLRSSPGGGLLTTPLSFLQGFTLTIYPYEAREGRAGHAAGHAVGLAVGHAAGHAASHSAGHAGSGMGSLPGVGSYCLLSCSVSRDFLALTLTCKEMSSLFTSRALLPFTSLLLSPPPPSLPPFHQLSKPLSSHSPLSLAPPSSRSASSLLPVTPTFENDGGAGGLAPPSLLLQRLNARALRQYCRENRCEAGFDSRHEDPLSVFSRLTVDSGFEVPADSRRLGFAFSPVPKHPPSLKSFLLPPSSSSLPSRSSASPTILSSYPRSGNTLLRSLLERLTLTPTGSDTAPTRPLSFALAKKHNLVGEGVTDHRVSVIKTHWPERSGHARFAGSRVLLVVRNPFDVIDSYWNMCCTNTHTDTVADAVYEKYADMYNDFARAEAGNWGRFVDWWMKACRKNRVALCVVRYEDLVGDAVGTMQAIAKFTGEGGREGGGEGGGGGGDGGGGGGGGELKPEISERISALFQTDISSLGSYKPRSGGGGKIGKALARGRFTEETVQHIVENTMYIKQLGYAPPEFPQNFNGGGEGSGGGVRGAATSTTTPTFPLVFTNDSDGTGSVVCNEGPELRRPNDPYGRAMTAWRRTQTDEDRMPFEKVPK